MDFNDFKRQKVIARNEKRDIAWYQGMFRLAALDGKSTYAGPVDGEVNSDLVAAIAELQLASGLARDPSRPGNFGAPPTGGWEPLGLCPGYGSESFARLLQLPGLRNHDLWVVPGCSRPFFLASLGESATDRFDQFTWIDADGTIVEADANLVQLREKYPNDAEILLAQYGPSASPADRSAGARQRGSDLPSISNPLPGQRTRNDRRGQGTFNSNRDGGTRQHRGFDIEGVPGTSVYSPITGAVTAIGFPYSGELRTRSVVIAGNGQYAGMVVRVLYLIDPVSVEINENVTRGVTVLGTLWDLRLIYPGIRPHVHLEVTHNGIVVDPSQLIDEWRER